MKNLYAKINQFYKLATEFDSNADLEKLLKQALAEGSNDTFLVFLDMLGEVNPPIVEKIKKFKRTREVLIKLNELFPNIITFKHDKYFDFNSPFFIKEFKGIGLFQNGKSHNIYYDDFNYYLTTYDFAINININGPILEGQEINSISKLKNSNTIRAGLYGDLTGHWGNYRATIYRQFIPLDEEYEFLQQVIQNYQGKAEGDLTKIQNLFKTK